MMLCLLKRKSKRNKLKNVTAESTVRPIKKRCRSNRNCSETISVRGQSVSLSLYQSSERPQKGEKCVFTRVQNNLRKVKKCVFARVQKEKVGKCAVITSVQEGTLISREIVMNLNEYTGSQTDLVYNESKLI